MDSKLTGPDGALYAFALHVVCNNCWLFDMFARMTSSLTRYR